MTADHLSLCEHCFEMAEDLRAFKTQVAPGLDRDFQPTPALETPGSPSPRLWNRLWKSGLFSPQRSPAFVFGAALATLLLVIGGWLGWRAIQRKDSGPDVSVVTPSPTATPSAPPSPTPSVSLPASPAGPSADVVAQLNDGGGQVTLDREGKLEGVGNLPPAYQQLIKDTLSRRRIEKSPLLAGLNRPGSSLMGGGDRQENQFAVIEPAGIVTLADRPTFRWARLEGASSYVVEVYDGNFNLVMASPSISAASWTALQPLKRGGSYSWQVKAVKDGQEFISPRPPAPQAKFRVLDQAMANELAQARRDYASSRLALGLLYARAGLLEDAERELRALQKDNPNSTQVRQLLLSLQAMRR
jgi:hypothetical protein